MANRRKLIKTAAGWILGCEVLVAIGGAGCSGGSSGDDDDDGATPGPTPVGGILTLPIAEYPALSSVDGDQVFNITGTGRIVVAQVSSGVFVSVGASCPHQGTTIGWNGNADEFVCPNHGSTFDQDGNVTGGPAVAGVPSYPTTFDGTNVVIDLN
jgi:cytochrome b6-f complex iron-sulfur subunit